MNRQSLVWAVILNWNGLDDTRACLASLDQLQCAPATLHVLVIDNGSTPDPSATLRHEFPAVEVVRFATNQGFAAGCNYGMERALAAGADYVLLLNNDTIVAADFLSGLINQLAADPAAGIAGPLICYADQPQRVWFAGATMLPALGYFSHRYLNQPRSRVPQQPFASDYITGCCMLIDADVLRRIGLFDARYFAYFEDAEFCMRARKAGFAPVCVPASVIWHKESASTRRNLTEGTTSPLKHYLAARNRTVTVLRHCSAGERVVYLLVGNTIILWYYLSAFLLRRRWKKMVWLVRGFVDGLLQRFEYPGL